MFHVPKFDIHFEISILKERSHLYEVNHVKGHEESLGRYVTDRKIAL
jgi:hypothetical protein